MKKYIIILFVLFTTVSLSQMRNQRQNRLPIAQDAAPKPNFKVERYVGIIKYDIKKAAKKSSIKLSSKEGKEFSKILTKYNKDIKDITRINSFLLRSTKEMVETFQKTSMKSGDFSNQPKVLKKMNENLKPIVETLKIEDRKLDKTLKSLLSDKQYSKWIKYNKKIYKFFPKE